MGDFTAIGSALYNACDNASTVPVYYALAPQGSATPYIVINRQAGIDERNWSGTLVSTDYQVQVVTNKHWPDPAASIYEAVHASINGTALTLTGYTAMRCERTSTLEYRDPDGYWHVGGLYRIDVY